MNTTSKTDGLLGHAGRMALLCSVLAAPAAMVLVTPSVAAAAGCCTEAGLCACTDYRTGHAFAGCEVQYDSNNQIIGVTCAYGGGSCTTCGS
jgi:hypothetical protein